MGLGVAAGMDRRWRGKALAAAQDPATAELPGGHGWSLSLSLSMSMVVVPARLCRLCVGGSVVPDSNDRAPAAELLFYVERALRDRHGVCGLSYEQTWWMGCGCWNLDTANESTDAAIDVAWATRGLPHPLHDGMGRSWLAWQMPELRIRWVRRQAAGRQGR